jgi:hypothetical protein
LSWILKSKGRDFTFFLDVEAGINQTFGLIQRDQQGDEALSETEATKGPNLSSQGMGTNIRRNVGFFALQMKL